VSTADGTVEDEARGRALLAEYDRLWREHGSAAKVREALGLRLGEHFEIAAWRLPGAIRVARNMLSEGRSFAQPERTSAT
jgi:hypothetical protein